MRNQRSERVALKDQHLVYRACSTAFARSVGKNSPDEIIGKTDFDIFPRQVAREQMALDSQTMFSARADISAINLAELNLNESANQAMIVRTPVMTADEQVAGIDIRLVSGPQVIAPRSAVTIDYQTLVNEGIQGSLIIAKHAVLFANDNAAKVLGYDSAQSMIDTGHTHQIFTDEELDLINDHALKDWHGLDDDKVPGSPGLSERVTLSAHTCDGKPVRLIARVTQVQWGASRATLLSFVDVALPDVPVPVFKQTAAASIRSEHADLPAQAKSGNNSFTSVNSAEIAANAVWAAGNSNAANVQSVPVATPGKVAGVTTVESPEATNGNELRNLRLNLQRYRHYTSAAADFVWEIDEKLMFRVVSEQLTRILGIPREHLIGRTTEQLMDHPGNVNDAGHFESHLQRLGDHQPFRDFEFRWSVGGETRVLRLSGIPVFRHDGHFLGFRGVGCDVTASVREAESTAYHANHDALTGLVNRRHFERKVSDALEASRQNRQAHVLCFMDLDNFKIVNDTCGHQAGDELLRQLAQMFDQLVRKSDVLGRLGGDEFGVFLYKCGVPEALKLANQIRHEVENFEFLWEENRFTVGVSVGLVVVDDRWESIESAFSAADSACYIAKNEGRNRVVVYREGEGNVSNRKVATHWVEEINTALEENRLRLACQKIQALGRQQTDGQSDGLRGEMLLRLEMPDGSLINPQSFMPSAERYGLTAALDVRAIELTLDWLHRNPGIEQNLRHVSINLSSGSFTNIEFADVLIAMIAKSGVSPEKLCFELTETATIANLSKASEFMRKVAETGSRFSIDNFGSGLSSFAYIRKLPIDFLKVDGLLIKDILNDPTDKAMVQAINDIVKSMGKRTVAEYVESPRLMNAVSDIGIDFAQGFHIGKPELIN